MRVRNSPSAWGEKWISFSWISSAAFDRGEADLTFRFGERYKLSLWSDGRAAFYDGYAGRSTKSHAYYSIPAGVVGELTAALAVSAPA